MIKRIVLVLLMTFIIICESAGVYEASTKSSIVENEVVEITNKTAVDEIMEESIITQKSGASVEGTYKSGELATGFTGITYRVSFDWVAIGDGKGDYIFSDISNFKVSTIEYTNVLFSIWSSCTYKLDVSEVDYEEDPYVVEVDITYTFYTVRVNDIFGRLITTVKELSYTKTCNSLTK